MVDPYRLLIADDDDALRESLRGSLEIQGYTVMAAGSGREAIAVARTQRIDLAILDFRIGDMTGLEVFRQLRTLDPLTASILVSAELESSLRSQAQVLGIGACIAKPIALETLRVAVATVLRTSTPSRPPRAPGPGDPLS